MHENILKMRDELGIVEAFGLLDTYSNLLDYSDLSEEDEDVIEKMSELSCFNGLDFLYLNMGTKKFFLMMHQEKIAILLLKNGIVLNKTLIQLKVKALISVLS